MRRKIHLDFHTAPETTGIGEGFDPDRFAETLAAAHVDCLATPGKCHFGHVYTQSDIAPVHPHLCDPDLFPRTVAACRRRGIAVQAYWTLGLDATMATRRPAWRQRFADGTHAHWGHYLHMCFASPYVEQAVIPEVLECIERCPGLAGFWFDICLYVDGAFYSPDFNRLAAERLREGAAPTARWHLARALIRGRCRALEAAIQRALPGAENYYNSLVNPGEGENIPLQPVQEVENPILFGGPEKLSTHARWLRSHAAPTVGLVSRFQGPWSDPGTLRTADQMHFDVARTVALGCAPSMGDHRYPDGHLEAEVYQRLSPTYATVKALSPWLDATQPCREAVLIAPVICQPGQGQIVPKLSETSHHAARLLEELGVQFDIMTPAERLPAADLVIWPGEEPGSAELTVALRDHCARGGALLGCHHALTGLEDTFGASPRAWHAPRHESGGNDMDGCGHVGAVSTEQTACGPAGDFLVPDRALGLPETPLQLTQPARLLECKSPTEILARRHPPASHRPAFASPAPTGPLAVRRGRAVYCAADLFGEDRENGNPGPRALLDALLTAATGTRLVRHSAGPSVAAHLHRMPDGALLHLVHWALDRRGKAVNPTATFPRLGSLEVALALAFPVAAVQVLPQGESLPFAQHNGTVSFTVPGMRIWQRIGIFRKD